ncbi:Lrp/AsnC family transcriptional regulator [Roseibium polysiphoniae]|uniref:Lrp/AsnC family transcriptional regulator n=1 Tax=Roseibium polysiphoniae TaxID=2571221 RepID=A0A927Q2Q1_9HYPH|nr:Lrp/AsnC family transcriptional regulator [Roseibium polysiphoniae]MBD8874973.1 Lrp/AsnC family transcriptional regulator [Roseibium polysiphoniae]MBS8258868.1 Lrp/AsnC family transcriptional regulator [Roseibium polysiphoniae]
MKIDDIDRQLLEELLGDARLPLKELASRVGLSSPSVSDRLRRLEEGGVIRGFTIDVDPKAVGYLFQTMVRVRPLPGTLHVVQKMLQDIPQITECDKVTGEDCFIARLHVRSMEELDEILDKVSEKSETSTAVVKAQPVTRRLPPIG